MEIHSKTASLAGLAGSVVKNAVDASSYQITPTLSTPILASEYAVSKVASRFRINLSTARLVCHLAGIGGQQ